MRLGYTCPCGKEHKFDGWAAAHLHVELVHVCDCGRDNVIKKGKYAFTKRHVPPKESILSTDPDLGKTDLP